MNEKCKYCGSPLAYCNPGEYCSNKDCGYIDGYYFGSEEKPSKEDTLAQVDKELMAIEEKLKYLNKSYITYIKLCRQKVSLMLPPGEKPKTIGDILDLL